MLNNTLTAIYVEDQLKSKNADSSFIQQSYYSLNNILQSFSTVDGKIDYTSIMNNPFNLNIFLKFSSIIGSNSYPYLFSEEHAKAY